MLRTVSSVFRTPDLRRKILFTIAIMVIFRVGSLVPTPGVDYGNVREAVSVGTGDSFLGLANLFSGGALLQLSVFALGIMPYITASIIVQLLRVVIPRFEELHKEGQSGQAKLTQYTRYLTVALGVIQSTTIVVTARTGVLMPGYAGDLLVDDGLMTSTLMVVALVAGTALVMWLGEMITERGVGNGMSILIFVNIAAGFPSGLWSVAGGSGGWWKLAVVLALIVTVVMAVVYVEQSQRRIPVQYAKRQVGRRMYGGTTTYIPFKINMAGVIPVIFASSVLAIPSLVAQFGSADSAWVKWVQDHVTTQSAPLHVALYVVLIVFFTFFHVSITADPYEQAENLKKYGGFIPGIRAGRPTAEYLEYVLTRLTSAGSLYLAVLALIPTVLVITLGITSDLPFGGSTILIVVGVGLETVKQINSQLEQRHYEGFLR